MEMTGNGAVCVDGERVGLYDTDCPIVYLND